MMPQIAVAVRRVPARHGCGFLQMDGGQTPGRAQTLMIRERPGAQVRAGG